MISPKNVHKAAQKRERENLRFRSFLKNHADPEELDRQFASLHQELFAGYDCCQCANCCRAYDTTLDTEDIRSISAYLGLTESAFREEYLVQGAEGWVLEAPCRFLLPDGKCKIELCKPRQCKDYPHTDKPERLFSLYSTLASAEQCPIVFEILERLKEAYHFRR